MNAEDRDEFFNAGDRVHHNILGEGTITKVFLLHCEIKFDNLKTERTIDKRFIKVVS